MYLGVSKIRGTPKWMVYNGKPYYSKMDDFGGITIFENTHLYLLVQKSQGQHIPGMY